MDPELNTLLRDHRARFAPTYRGGLTNHLPMCAIALARLGAPMERVRAFASTYERNLEPLDPLDATTFVARSTALAAEMRARGRDVVLRERLHTLVDDIASDAFHGAIRVAYATMLVGSGADVSAIDELAYALVYWADNAQRIPVEPTGKTTELADLVDRLRAARIEKPTGFTITERLVTVAADPRFVEIARALRVTTREAAEMISQVSAHGARTYLAADDFASLHVLTGAHATRLLTKWMDPETKGRAARALALAALACFVVSGSPGRQEMRGVERADWSEIVTRATAATSEDDHLAKLVVSCRDEEAAVSDQIYRIVATKIARRGTT